ncbi:hypothetical protein [Brotaphodocola sp.]|uniref:hypothetical protein n=1 Tax=Brotaphodocola sp. TaxID=3073577 RepID=UPI003D7E4E92
MNYLKEIIAFEEWLERGYLSASSQLLWYKLMYRCNRLGWTEWVQVDNLRLMSDVRIDSKNTFLRARDALVEAGRVEVRKGKKGSPNQYRIIPFFPEEKKGSNFEPKMEPEMKLQMEPETEPQTGHINKHKLKHKKNNSNELSEKPELFSSAIATICEEYNRICESYPRLVKITEKRKQAIRARLNTGYTVEDFVKVFELAEKSKFLRGKNDRNWSANFDWLINDQNMAKVLEGKYKDRPEQKKLEVQKNSAPNRFHNFEERNTDYDSMVMGQTLAWLKNEEDAG